MQGGCAEVSAGNDGCGAWHSCAGSWTWSFGKDVVTGAWGDATGVWDLVQDPSLLADAGRTVWNVGSWFIPADDVAKGVGELEKPAKVGKAAEVLERVAKLGKYADEAESAAADATKKEADDAGLSCPVSLGTPAGGGRVGLALAVVTLHAAGDGGEEVADADPAADEAEDDAEAVDEDGDVTAGHHDVVRTGSKETGKDLERTAKVGDDTWQITTGHGCCRERTGPGGVRNDPASTGLGPDRIEQEIIDDTYAFMDGGGTVPTPGPGFLGPLERTVTIDGKSFGYRLTRTSDGVYRVATYWYNP